MARGGDGRHFGGSRSVGSFLFGPLTLPPPPTTRAPNPHAYHAPRPSYVVCHIQNFFSLHPVSRWCVPPPPPLSLPGNQVRHGLCGDSVESSQPYLTPGPVVATLPAGSVLQTTVVITAHHKGHIEMWLCPDGDAPLTQSCLNQYSLAVVPVTEADGSTTPTDPAYPGACCRPLHPRTRLQQLWLRVRNELHVCSCVRGGGGEGGMVGVLGDTHPVDDHGLCCKMHGTCTCRPVVFAPRGQRRLRHLHVHSVLSAACWLGVHPLCGPGEWCGVDACVFVWLANTLSLVLDKELGRGVWLWLYRASGST